MSLRGAVIVTGTDTGVGKTVVTAAIASSAAACGLRVAVVKPGQTGTAMGYESDVDTIVRLAGPDRARTLAAYPDPLAPLAAARVSGLPALELADVVDAVRADVVTHDLVLVEGAGGLLVPIGRVSEPVKRAGDPAGDTVWTIADLAVALEAPAVVVARAALGTLNHTALTLEALRRRGVAACVVFGAWPAVPELVHLSNFVDLAPDLAGVVPDGAGALEPGVFRRSAPGWLAPILYGAVDDVREWVDGD